ncbi:hypothetical protein GNI_091370 [Gregarina niphandrodes]|uniref:Uncharacterized protein n=1 Tax=Gregarina niphandrodes TaxID=110365 RepID=A0A023B5K0_GRENI|nr:hypothetical protein GNI_091370 [Gregarina niphandrodes]EZG59930.1 hypothetical protein GNI_091370 [Gregarina niphandrodes]|eukprot:XP_011130870.1 hypothetical protein GNI_091370 [Gregarina niphandrodes]
MKGTAGGATNSCGLGLLLSVMTDRGERPSTADCQLKMVELRSLVGDNTIKFAVLIPRGDILTFCGVDRVRKKYDWIARCSRIRWHAIYNDVDLALVVRDFKEFLTRKDPKNEFSNMSDQIWLDCFHWTKAALLWELEKVRESNPEVLSKSLQVVDCRNLTKHELECFPDWRAFA